MARQAGNMKMEGTFGDLTFYKMKGNYYVRSRRVVSSIRFQKSPEFARVRENGNEFAAAVKSGKLLRDCVKCFYRDAHNHDVSTRVLQLMLKVKTGDVESARGKRNAGTAFASGGALSMLKHFEFNGRKPVASLLRKPFQTDADGTLVIHDFVPARDLAASAGSTHVMLKSALCRVDFMLEKHSISYTNTVTLCLDDTASEIVLVPESIPTGTGILFSLLQIEFFQEVSGVLYNLKSLQDKAVVIAEVY
jgi:hypothetical protein